MRGWKGLPGRNNLLEGLGAYGGAVVSGVSQALGVLLLGVGTPAWPLGWGPPAALSVCTKLARR